MKTDLPLPLTNHVFTTLSHTSGSSYFFCMAGKYFGLIRFIDSSGGNSKILGRSFRMHFLNSPTSR